MLVIMRKAEQNGGVGSSFMVGDLKVSVLSIGMFAVKMKLVFSDGSVSVSNVPYDGELRPLPGVAIMTRQVNRSPYRGRNVRIAIDAPKHMHIERDDIKHRLAA